MTLTAKEISDLNTMNVAAQNVALGTLVSPLDSDIATLLEAVGANIGTHIITETEASASTIEIETGITSISGWLLSINRSGSTVTYDAKATVASGSVLKIEDGASTYVTSASDVITYFII
jgi:hypothetical protein